ncbi:RICIN domain-containing protein [Rugosimonospora africana]|uniref:Ricin B lectin domain-containing protein n=1 Tax=Rugosimonospora africana TaxID=556532 RepID=A0A8J3VVD4_9ACTN|nr:RICIN domain-containing protein [Rugosimonospora africana]GIH20532.1 hypothetical protein Raf01_87040 [Rugosimonospora africana]
MASFPAARLLTTLVSGALASGLALPSGAPAHARPTVPARPAAAAAGPGTTAATGVPDAASALAMARRTGRPVEITSERTETGQVFANPTGTRTLEQYALPVRTRRDGRWVPIDTRLVRNSDGTVSPGATVTGLRLSGGGSGPLVSAAQGDRRLSLSWPAPLPVPVLDGDTATYRAVLPGVDLQVRVDAIGFSELLVVHDAAAARNPALRRIRLRTGTEGLTLRADPDGGSTALGADGRAVFVSGTPMMWESRGADPDRTPTATLDATPAAAATGSDGSRAPRQRAMHMEVAAGQLTVVPDATLLSAPDVRYPLYIDPSYSAAQYRWTIVSGSSKTTSYWTDSYYHDDMRVGLTYGTGEGPWRTFFQVNTAPLAHATVSQAWVSVSMTHSANCAATSVELWHTNTIDPTKAVTWNNTASSWLGGKALDTQSGKANKPACGQSPMLMEFGVTNGSVQAVAQDAATGAAGPQEAVAFGLRIPSAHESDDLYWKRFDPATARLNVVYNTPPLAPTSVSTVPPTPCGTVGAPTPLNTTTPTFGAVGYDPNGDLISDDLDILSGSTVLDTENSGTVGSGDAANWLTVPAGVLPSDQPTAVFGYRARTRDGTLAGPYSTPCYFTVDTTRPTPPSVTSTDYPNGVPVRSVGELGTVTFTRAGGDTDVASFQYGFTPDATTMSVVAATDGTATVPVTLWPAVAGDGSDVSRTLYVRAVDRAGNVSPLNAGWVLAEHGRVVTAPAARADLNGDRRGDVSTVVDQGYDRTTVWNWVAGQGGFSTGYVGWDSGINGGFGTSRIASVDGDFNGDGRTDVAMFREDPDAQVRLFLLLSDGTRYNAASQPVWTGSGWRVSHLKLVAGDFNGDGYDDIAALQGLAGGQSKLWVQLSNRGAFGNPVLQWDSGAGNLALEQANLVAGDFDGDGYTDIADVVDAGGGVSRLMVHASNHGQFGAPVTAWASAAGTFSANRARFVAGNADGDAAHRDEILALYDDGSATAHLAAFTDQGGTWTTGTWWSSGAGGFDASHAVTFGAGDYDGDGRTDVAALYDTGAGTRRLYTFTSSGIGFADKQDRWDGYVGAALPAPHIDQTRKYRIQPSYDSKCLDVPGGSTADGTALDQWDCVATATWEQFALVPVGDSPYYEFRTAAGKCVEVRGWSLLDAAPIDQSPCAAGGPAQPNQHFRLDYVSGSGRDILVQIRDVHSDACLSVTGSGTANGAAIVQAACGAPAPANQLFFVRVDP